VVTYVLGAGASLDAGYPLASNLGEALREWIYRTKPVNDDSRICIDQMIELYGGLGNLEEILTDLDTCLPGSRAATLPTHIRPYLLPAFRWSIREFFNDLRERPAHLHLYKRLAHERVHLGDVVITFNYDVACERQLKQAGLWEIGDGYGFSIRLDALPPSRVKVLKLHGSTNWFGQMFGGKRGTSQYSDVYGPGPVIFFRADLEFLGYPTELRDRRASADEAAGHAAMIMPTLHKSFFEQTAFGREWEPFWNDLWGMAGSALAASDKIVIIGYGMASVDEKARELMLRESNRDAHIAIFCAGKSTAICNEFKSRGYQRVETFGEGRFEDFLSH
jgi:hypothetical protein